MKLARWSLVPEGERRHAPPLEWKAPPPRWTEQTMVKTAPCPARKEAVGRRVDEREREKQRRWEKTRE